MSRSRKRGLPKCDSFCDRKEDEVKRCVTSCSLYFMIQILFLSSSVLLPPLHLFIPLLRLTFSPLSSIPLLYRYFGYWFGTVFFSLLGHSLDFLHGWRSWSFSVYSGRPRRRLTTMKRTL